jgi:hypothetical protein
MPPQKAAALVCLGLWVPRCVAPERGRDLASIRQQELRRGGFRRPRMPGENRIGARLRHFSELVKPDSLLAVF